MKTSPKKRIATYAVAGTAVLSGGIGSALAVFAGGADAADSATPSAAATPAPRDGRPERPHVDDVAVAATALGLDPAALRSELEAGKSIRQVVTEKGLDVQKAIDAIIAAHEAGLADHVKDEVDRVGLGHHPGGRGHHGPRPQGSADTSATPSSTTTG